MKKAQFITALEAKPQFIKWAVAPALAETVGDIEKWHGRAYITTPNGANVLEVWFIVDAATGEANWQNADTIDTSESVEAKKMTSLENYLKTNFDAHFLGRIDLDNLWAEADVFKLTNGALTQSKVLVFKKGSAPVAHLNVV